MNKNNSLENSPSNLQLPQDDNKSTNTVPSDQYEIPVIVNPNAKPILEQDTTPIVIYEKTEEQFIKILRSIQGLTDQQIRIIEVRYLSILRAYRTRIKYINFLYNFTRLFISLGGVAVPALLSIQTPNNALQSESLFWFTWFISLSVTVLQNISNIFRFDKKYLGINSTIDKLSSEGWQYLELSGKYTSHPPHPPATHANQFQLFVNTVEKIKGKQSQQEFNSSMETENKINTPILKTTNQTSISIPKTSNDSFYVPP